MITVRTATPDDASAVANIHQQAIDDGNAFVQEPDEFVYSIPEKKKFIEDILSLPRSTMIVAEQNDKVAGWLFLREHEMKRLNHVVMLGMAVDHRARGKGVGKALVKAAINWGREHPNVHRIELAVIEDNHAAVKLYESCGFEIEGVGKNEIRSADGNFSNMLQMGLLL